jgi:hypothetical protein
MINMTTLTKLEKMGEFVEAFDSARWDRKGLYSSRWWNYGLVLVKTARCNTRLALLTLVQSEESEYFINIPVILFFVFSLFWRKVSSATRAESVSLTLQN